MGREIYVFLTPVCAWPRLLLPAALCVSCSYDCAGYLFPLCRSLADILAQLLERHQSKRQTHLLLPQYVSPSNKSVAADYGAPAAWQFSFPRLLRLASFAALIFAPCTKAWFEFLAELYPGSGWLVALQRMATDQIFYSVTIISALFLWTALWESGGSLSFARAKLRSNLWPAMKANWMLWPAVQLVNQSIVPLHARMLVAALVNVPWTMYLAMRAGSKAAASSPTGGVELATKL